MADRFTLIVNTPDREFYRGDATMLELTTSEGDIGIYAGHIPLTAVIVPGVMTIHTDEGIKSCCSWWYNRNFAVTGKCACRSCRVA